MIDNLGLYFFIGVTVFLGIFLAYARARIVRKLSSPKIPKPTTEEEWEEALLRVIVAGIVCKERNGEKLSPEQERWKALL